jgi:hypothetical protein
MDRSIYGNMHIRRRQAHQLARTVARMMAKVDQQLAGE